MSSVDFLNHEHGSPSRSRSTKQRPSCGALLAVPAAVWFLVQLVLLGWWSAGASLDTVSTISFVGVVVLMANIFGQIPLFFVTEREPDRLVSVLITTTALRSSFALLGFVVVYRSLPDMATAVGAFAGWYGGLLMVDLAVTVRYFKKTFADNEDVRPCVQSVEDERTQADVANASVRREIA